MKTKNCLYIKSICGTAGGYPVSQVITVGSSYRKVRNFPVSSDKHYQYARIERWDNGAKTYQRKIKNVTIRNNSL
jgi:hypothetical protein